MADAPTFFSDGHTPKRTDPKWRIEQKILGALQAGDGGSGAGGLLGVFYPDTVAILKAIPTAATHRRAFLGGLNSVGDGFGCSLFWNADDTRTDVNLNGEQLLSVVRPNDVALADPGRWNSYTA